MQYETKTSSLITLLVVKVFASAAVDSCFQRRFTFARIDISYARFFLYESAEKVLSYARLNCAVFNYFYMSFGQVRHTIVVSLSTFFHLVHDCVLGLLRSLLTWHCLFLSGPYISYLYTAMIYLCISEHRQFLYKAIINQTCLSFIRIRDFKIHG